MICLKFLGLHLLLNVWKNIKSMASIKNIGLEVFLSIFIGYAAYYFIRKNFNMAVPYLIETYGFTKTQIGLVGSALGLSYGLSKFIMGNISDRCNPRYFMSAGLILSGIVNLLFGYASSMTMLFVLMFLNGWFQGMGWPPCGRIMTHWFSDKERGIKMSVWNVAHNIGGAFGSNSSINRFNYILYLERNVLLSSYNIYNCRFWNFDIFKRYTSIGWSSSD